MRTKSIIVISAVVVSSLLITACGSAPSAKLTSKSKLYQDAFNDGCTTAKGYYTKNHDAFKTNIDYHEGWFTGRQHCQPIQTYNAQK